MNTENKNKPLLLAVTTTQDVNMGDHGERLVTALEYIPGETVEALVRRAMPKIESRWQAPNYTDEVTIRVIAGTGGDPGPLGETPF